LVNDSNQCIWPNTYLDDTWGKIVIYSWSVAARREKKRQKVYLPDTEEEKKVW
jgi:hypothetical protein